MSLGGVDIRPNGGDYEGGEIIIRSIVFPPELLPTTLTVIEFLTTTGEMFSFRLFSSGLTIYSGTLPLIAMILHLVWWCSSSVILPLPCSGVRQNLRSHTSPEQSIIYSYYMHITLNLQLHDSRSHIRISQKHSAT